MGCGVHLAQLWYMLYLLSILSRVRLNVAAMIAAQGGGVSVYSAPDNAPVLASAAPSYIVCHQSPGFSLLCSVWTKTAVHQ